MKKLIFVLFLLFPIISSYGQATLKIDSVDFSRVRETLKVGHDIVFHVGGSTTPRMRIVATIKNHSDKDIFVFYPDHRTAMNIRFSYRKNIYHQNIGLKNFGKGWDYSSPDANFGRWLEPQESMILELWGFAPTKESAERHQMGDFFATYPLDFDWDKDVSELTDADYVAWFKEIFQQMRIIVSYGPTPYFWKVHEVISDPLDLEKVVVTSNLTEEKLIDEQTLKHIRETKDAIKALGYAVD